MKKNMTNGISFTDLYNDRRSFQKKQDTRGTLADIAASHNLYSKKCIELTDKIMEEVRRYHAMYTMTEEDTCKAMQTFFQSLDGCEAQKRIAILDEMVFAMELFGDEALLKEAGEKGFDSVFQPIPADLVYDDSLENEMELKDRLMEQVEKMNLSPLALRHMAYRLKKTPTAAYAFDLAQDSYQLKCAAAMRLYLANRDTLSVSEAVAFACSDIYMREAANAVGLGELAEKAALAILLAIIVAAMIYLAGFSTLTPAYVNLLGSIGIGVFLYQWLSPNIRLCAGELVTGLYDILLSAKDAATAGLEKIANYVREQRSAKIRHEVELEMMDAIWNEEMQNTYLDEEEEVFAY